MREMTGKKTGRMIKGISGVLLAMFLGVVLVNPIESKAEWDSVFRFNGSLDFTALADNTTHYYKVGEGNLQEIAESENPECSVERNGDTFTMTILRDMDLSSIPLSMDNSIFQLQQNRVNIIVNEGVMLSLNPQQDLSSQNCFLIRDASVHIKGQGTVNISWKRAGSSIAYVWGGELFLEDGVTVNLEQEWGTGIRPSIDTDLETNPAIYLCPTLNLSENLDKPSRLVVQDEATLSVTAAKIFGIGNGDTHFASATLYGRTYSQEEPDSLTYSWVVSPGSAGQSQSGGSVNVACQHNYQYEIIKAASDTEDGEFWYRCTKCGDVLPGSCMPISAFGCFCTESRDKILNSKTPT